MPAVARRLGSLAAAALLAAAPVACSRSDARPAPAGIAASANGAVAGAPADSTVFASADRGRIRGAEGARVTLIEISDFQCPYCKAFHDGVHETIDREYVQTGKIRHAFINFPLAHIHPNATPAAEAAMCASAQGRFWELQDALFDTQAAWAKAADAMPLFDSLATAAKVDMPQWRSCMTSHAAAGVVANDLERARGAGVKSTPTFFIGNRGLVGTYPVDSFRVILDDAIAKARRTP